MKKFLNYKNIIIVITFLGSVLIAFFTINSINSTKSQIEQKFKADLSKMKTIIDDEVSKYIYGMQGTKGTIVDDNFNLSPVRYRKYAESRDFFNNFSGSLGFGFIRAVNPKDLASYIIKNKQNFVIHPQSKSNLKMIIELIEPIEKNGPALGLDISFEKYRKNAALYAARTGKASITKAITLVQKNKEHTGFLYLLPIYDTISTPKTEQKRINHLVGWSYTPIVLEDLIDQIKKKTNEDLSIAIRIEGKKNPFYIGKQFKKDLFLNNQSRIEIQFGETSWKINSSFNPSEFYETFVFLISIYLLSQFILLAFGYIFYKHFQQQLSLFSENTSWMNAIVESAGHAIIATNPQGIITTFNTTAENILGYKSHELINKESPAILHDINEVVDRARVLTQELNIEVKPGFDVFVIKTHNNVYDINEWTYIKKNGERIPIRLCVSVIKNEHQQIIGYLGIAEDLTEQKKLIKVIDIQKAQMIEHTKLSLLGEMAGGIAHEINTPLAIIIGKCESLLRQIQIEKDGQLKNQIMKIKDTAERIGKIVKSLRVFSRNSDNDPFTIDSVSSVIDCTLDLCQEKFKYSHVKINTNIECDYNVQVRFTEVTQILMNLLSNAFDAIENNNDKWVEIEVKKIKSNVLISVTDSGLGISIESIDKIMNPFFTTKSVGKGTGLGLSISKSIAETNNGKLFYDKTCENTRFCLELPYLSEIQKKSVS